MSRPTRARQDCRLDVLKKLDPVSEPKESACTSDSDALTVIKDTVLAPAAQAEDFVGDWIYIRSQPTAIDSTSTVTGVHNTTTTNLAVSASGVFTVGDGIQVTVGAVTETRRVTTIIDGTNLTVDRGIQGSTAVATAGGEAIYIVGPAIGEIARITNVDFSGSTSTLTVAPAFSASPVNTQEYERHRKVRPNIINDKLDTTLGLLRQDVLLPSTIIVDGDMEDDPATNFAVGGTETLANDTTYVRHGRQSLKVTAGAADDYAKSTTATYLPGGTQVLCSTECYITAGDAAKLILYDETNSANIETAESDESGWVLLAFLATVPTTCEEVSVRLEAQNNGDVVYFDHITLWPTYDQGIELPSFLEFIYDVKGLFYYPVGTGLAGSANDNAYRINEGSPQFYAHFQKEQDDTAVVSSRFYVEGSRPSHTIWIKGRKPYPAFSGATDALKDVDTTQAHKNVVANLTTASILDDLALDATEAEKPQLSESLQVKAMMLRNEVSGLLASMTPPKKKIITTPFTRK